MVPPITALPTHSQLASHRFPKLAYASEKRNLFNLNTDDARSDT